MLLLKLKITVLYDHTIVKTQDNHAIAKLNINCIIKSHYCFEIIW